MGLEKYESKQVRILRPAELIYTTLSDFSNFTPILRDKVEGWQATQDECSFKVKGFSVKLHIIEREPFKAVKISSAKGSPFDFTFWLQLQEICAEPQYDTRMRLVLHIELNMMMKMMVAGKIQEALDQIADQIAMSFNQTM